MVYKFYSMLFKAMQCYGDYTLDEIVGLSIYSLRIKKVLSSYKIVQIIAKILFDSKRECINLDFDTFGSPIFKIFFEIRKFKDINVFFQESILGDFRGINFTHLLT